LQKRHSADGRVPCRKDKNNEEWSLNVEMRPNVPIDEGAARPKPTLSFQL